MQSLHRPKEKSHISKVKEKCKSTKCRSQHGMKKKDGSKYKRLVGTGGSRGGNPYCFGQKQERVKTFGEDEGNKVDRGAFDHKRKD